MTPPVSPTRWVTAAIRMAIAACAVAVAALLPPVHGFSAPLVAIGAALAVAFPDRVGSGPVCAVSVVLAGMGHHDGAKISGPHALAFAIALYLLHEATSLAANVPLSAAASGGVVRRWAARCSPGVVAAVLALALTDVVARLPANPVLDVIGLAAVLLVVAATLVLLRAP